MRRGAVGFLALLLAALLCGCRWESSSAASRSPETSAVSTAKGSSSAASAGETTATTVTTVTTAPPTLQTLERAITAENAALYGRMGNEKDGLRLEWSGSGFALRVTGVQAEIRLRATAQGEEQFPYVRVWVNGRERETTAVQGDTVIRLPLGKGKHHIRLVRLSEAMGVAPLEVLSIRVTGEEAATPALLPPPQPPERRIEFIGDSLICGFGVDGQPYSVTGEPGRFLTAEEDVTKSIAGLTAAWFGADARYIAASGLGLCHNHPDKAAYRSIPQLFNLATPTQPAVWEHAAWQPQVVVISAGTNDYRGKTTPEELHTGTISFLERVRRAYPEAEIIWIYGMMGKKLEESLEKGIADYNAAWGDRVQYLSLDTIRGEEEQGALGHPNAAAYRDRAEPLVRLIIRLTGWEKQENGG